MKYVNRSYLECEWLPEAEVEKDPSLAEAKAYADSKPYATEHTELYDQEYAIAESVMLKRGRALLVKWKGLDYTQMTWELTGDIVPSLKHLSERYKLMCLGNQPKPLPPSEINELTMKVVARLNSGDTFCVSIEADPKVEVILRVLEAFQYLAQTNGSREHRFLVLVPTLSAAKVWEQIAQEKTWLNCVVYHGSEHECAIIRELRFPLTTQTRRGTRPEPYFNLLITTLQTFFIDHTPFLCTSWSCVFTDYALMYKDEPQFDVLSKKLSALEPTPYTFGFMVDNTSKFTTALKSCGQEAKLFCRGRFAPEDVSHMVISYKQPVPKPITLVYTFPTELQITVAGDITKRMGALPTSRLFHELELCAACPLLVECESSLKACSSDPLDVSGLLYAFCELFTAIPKLSSTMVGVFSKHGFILNAIKKSLDAKGIQTKKVYPHEAEHLPAPQPESFTVLLCSTRNVVLSPYKSLDLKEAIFLDNPDPFSDVFCFNNKSIKVTYVMLADSYRKKMYSSVKQRFGDFLLTMNAIFALDVTTLTRKEIDYL